MKNLLLCKSCKISWKRKKVLNLSNVVFVLSLLPVCTFKCSLGVFVPFLLCFNQLSLLLCKSVSPSHVKHPFPSHRHGSLFSSSFCSFRGLHRNDLAIGISQFWHRIINPHYTTIRAAQYIAWTSSCTCVQRSHCISCDVGGKLNQSVIWGLNQCTRSYCTKWLWASFFFRQ